MKRSLSMLMLAFVMSACADASLRSPGEIEHPTGRNDLLLRVSYEGGFVPVEYTFTAVPTFSLYGDGTLITPGAQIEIYPGPALPAIVERRLTEEGVQAVLEAALAAGLDRDGDHSDMGNMAVADAATTVFTFVLAGETHRVTAYALDLENDEEDPRRADLRSFQERLGTLDTWLPEGSAADEVSFDAASARILVGPFRPQEDLDHAPQEWPLGAALGGLGEPIEFAPETRCVVIGGADWSAVEPLAQESNQLTPWRSDGERYILTFRPLLPDESGC